MNKYFYNACGAVGPCLRRGDERFVVFVIITNKEQQYVFCLRCVDGASKPELAKS